MYIRLLSYKQAEELCTNFSSCNITVQGVSFVSDEQARIEEFLHSKNWRYEITINTPSSVNKILHDPLASDMDYGVGDLS